MATVSCKLLLLLELLLGFMILCMHNASIPCTYARALRPIFPQAQNHEVNAEFSDQLYAMKEREQSSNGLLLLMRKVLARMAADSKLAVATKNGAAAAAKSARGSEFNSGVQLQLQLRTSRIDSQGQVMLVRSNSVEGGDDEYKRRGVIRKLWEEVTGRKFPEREEEDTVGYSLQTLAAGIRGDTTRRRRLMRNAGKTVGAGEDGVVQADKRLVPGGPDPLHHSSQPLSP